VVEQDNKLEGVAAVIDKGLAAALLGQAGTVVQPDHHV